MVIILRLLALIELSTSNIPFSQDLARPAGGGHDQAAVLQSVYEAKGPYLVLWVYILKVSRSENQDREHIPKL
jgi:hypothetical protein